MEVSLLVVFLVIAVILSDLVGKILSKIPVMFLQIIIGMLLALFPIYHDFQINTEMFMFAVITPLLFSDAQRASRKDLKKYFRPILSLAVALVVASVVIMGFLIHTTLPVISVGLAVILAAVVTPTDMVAVKAITKTLHLPKGILPVLEGESLFNDATGVVAFNIAVATFLTGAFSLRESLFHFFFVSIGGLIFGLIIGFFVIQLRMYLMKKDFEDSSMIVLIQVLTPFMIFLLADKIGVSGILAVVSAGIFHGVERDFLRLTSTKLRMLQDNTWSVLNYALNGFVFVLLGLTLVNVFKTLWFHHVIRIEILIVESLLIYLFMTLLRFLWIQLFQPVFSEKYVRRSLWTRLHSDSRRALIYALSGIHGTIAISISLSIPLLLHDGSLFPLRNEIIFIVALVVLLSMIIPTFLLPKLAPRLTKAENEVSDLVGIRRTMLIHTLAELKSIALDEDKSHLAPVISALRNQLHMLSERREDRTVVLELLNKVYEIENATALKLYGEGSISRRTYQLYCNFAGYSHLIVSQKGIRNVRKHILLWLLRQLRRWREKNNIELEKIYAKKREDYRAENQLIQRAVSEASVAYLESLITPENYIEIYAVEQFYRARQERFFGKETTESHHQHVWFTRACQIEYGFVQDALNAETISADSARELREQIAYDEMAFITT